MVNTSCGLDAVTEGNADDKDNVFEMAWPQLLSSGCDSVVEGDPEYGGWRE